MATNRKINYHRIMLDEISKLKDADVSPRLLLHSCCAPCSSYVLEFLAQYFQMEIYFFNPNIHPEAEYGRRLEEQIRLVERMELGYRVIGPEHESSTFYEAIRGYEDLGEGSRRCHSCFELRLRRAAEYAKSNGFDYFTTTLTISPLKNGAVINEIGARIGEEYGIEFLHSDFKKNDGYRRSIELSREYNLYRQDYCGCMYSKREAIERQNRRDRQI